MMVEERKRKRKQFSCSAKNKILQKTRSKGDLFNTRVVYTEENPTEN